MLHNHKLQPMKPSQKASEILAEISEKTKLGDLRKMAKEIKKDHALAMELWQSGKFLPRQLAILIMDGKMLSQKVINELVQDMTKHPYDQQNQLMDWLMANQLLKEKKLIPLVESWENSEFPLQRRTFWYHQARLRWMGKKPPENTEYLLDKIEKNIASEAPEVQWTMNFTAGWIGIYNEKLRERCIKIGEKTGLYKGEMVSKGCTPSYLPEFIEIEVEKRSK